jgi:hypothetical protein
MRYMTLLAIDMCAYCLQDIIDGLHLNLLCGGNIVKTAATDQDPTGQPCVLKAFDGTDDRALLVQLVRAVDAVDAVDLSCAVGACVPCMLSVVGSTFCEYEQA